MFSAEAKGIWHGFCEVKRCINNIEPRQYQIVTSNEIERNGGEEHTLEAIAHAMGERVKFIAPVIVYGGENEMESLALGALRVQRGEEKAKEFVRTE